jgi:hypothetical protein
MSTLSTHAEAEAEADAKAEAVMPDGKKEVRGVQRGR